MLITEDMVLFYGGPFSQWLRARMIIRGERYNCCEQYMMQQKALCFGDYKMARLILDTPDPAEQKSLGKKVKNFCKETWEKKALAVVTEGNFHKFTQNEDLKKILLATGDKLIVEASPTDQIWGIGLAVEDPRALDKSQWRGTNWLGEAIMNVRAELRGQV